MVKHLLSHRNLVTAVYQGRLADFTDPQTKQPFRWINPKKPPTDLALATYTRKLLRTLEAEHHENKIG
jgi:hypothetical protein